MGEQREEAQLTAVPQLTPVVGFDRYARVIGMDDNSGVGSCLDRRACPEVDRDVDRLRAGMKEVERPDVQRAAGEVDASGSGGLDTNMAL